MLTIVNEMLSLTIVNETTNFIKNGFYGKTSWNFQTDALQVGFFSSLTIVNEGIVVNEG